MYDVILADPPWRYDDTQDAGKRGAAHKYELMGTEAIARLDVHRAASRACALYMWATWPLLADALYVMRRWGFEYKTAAFVWVKTTKDADNDCEDPDTRMGMGHYTRANTEPVLLGVKGSPVVVDHSVRQVVYSPHLGHSVKPQAVHWALQTLHGDVPRLELFARRESEGWDCWGLDLGIEVGQRLRSLPGQVRLF
jgi:site-specific DNA-methyltransferase (adenine-specific)